MTVRGIWDNEEQTIFRYILDPGWTWDEFFVAKKDANVVMDSVPHKFGVILHLPTDNAIPRDVLANARKGLLGKHPSAIVIVVVSERAFVRTMIETLRGLSPIINVGLEVTPTLEEARTLIHKYLRQLQDDNGMSRNP
jgi:hypothetical protein